MTTALEDLRAFFEERRLFAEDNWESFHQQALVACDFVAKLQPIIEKLEWEEQTHLEQKQMYRDMLATERELASCERGGVSKWISFQEDTPPAWKTKYWRVVANQGNAFLGSVKWWGGWRKYCFFPEQATIFEQDCLRDIAQFCESETAKHTDKP